MNRRLLLLAPLAAVAAGGVAFVTMLNRMQSGKFDPHDVGNPLVGKPMPRFALPPLPDHSGFTSADVQTAAAQQPVLLNFFASWCVPCAQEADVLASLAQVGLTLWGIAYEDKPENAQKFLDRYGNPYARIAADSTGRTAIDFGVYGVPESFLVGRDGVVHWHTGGPLTADVVAGPLQQALRGLS